MTNTAVKATNTHISPLDKARSLSLPSREAMLARTPAVQQFWHNNQEMLAAAWQEWELSTASELAHITDELIHPTLRAAVMNAWQDPQQELAVKTLWKEALPGVYQCQFFNIEALHKLRDYLDKVADAGIPLRPPYGIALNRKGAMLDKRSEGSLAAPSFQLFYQELMDRYMRPISRLLFPEIVGYDSQTFGFSIQYRVGMDTYLQPHTDASSATLNLNLNLPGEEFTGSEVDFFDRPSGRVERLRFEPGMAMLHRGSVAHAAQPITSGERTNMVLWLYGESMQTPGGNSVYKAVSPEQRWTIPKTEADKYAPF